MKKSTFLLIITSILFLGFNAHSQNNPRMENPDYAMTIFYDDFNNNWRDNWNPSVNRDAPFSSPNFGNILIWVDSTATIHQSTGNLYLTGLGYEGYTSTDWDDHQTTADYISGEVRSKDRFLYGVFECNATFGYKPGSFPAFWLFFDAPCDYDYGSEIDIAELKYESSTTGLDNHAYYYPCASGGFVEVPGSWKDNNFNWSTGSPHTFKCIWTPTKTEWYVDNTKLHTIYNTENNHYPNKTMDIRLSQQLYPYNNNMDNIDVPVTSTFHWVRAKEFFLAPEITVPDLICTNGTAIMDVDDNASNITWSLTPTNLFSGTKTGTGKTATITAATGVGGQGKITYSFSMPSGETFTAEKTFWVGVPVISNISGPLYTPNNQWATYYAETNDYRMAATDYNWILNPLNGNSVYDYGWSCDIAFYNSGSYQLIVQAKNQCSSPGYGPYYVTGVEVYDYQRLSISPNPTTGETTLAIESTSVDKTLDETVEWELEIYDSFQSLKEKRTKLKGKEHKIQTAGWKEGVYAVWVKYKDEILQGKLVVKK